MSDKADGDGGILGRHDGLYPLLRRFTLLSAVVLLVVGITIVQIYRTTAMGELTRLTEAQNAVLTHAIADSVWPQIADYVARAAEHAPEDLAGQPATDELAAVIEPLVADLPIAKVKVYGPDGLTVYSTDRAEIGRTEADSTEFAMALSGTVISEHEHDYALPDGRMIHIVESYVPIHESGHDGGGAGDRPVAGVFEVYADVTVAMERIHAMGWKLSALLLVAFGGLFLVLRMVVARGDRMIRQQYDALAQSGEAARRQNAALTKEVAKRVRAEVELSAARDAAEAGSRAKTEFLANMSHELRTPLNAIIGFSEAMLNESFGAVRPDRYRDYVHDIHLSGHSLLKLVDGILDLAKVEAGRMLVEIERFRLDTLVREVVAQSTQQAEQNGNRLVVDIGPDIGEVPSDPMKIRTILLNVVGNAVKYTERGEVLVTVRRERAAERGDAIVIRVADSGPGIEADRIGGIFDEFARRNPVLGKGSRGVGLGLSIARRFAELLGGSIDLASAPGRGTVVTVTIPPASDAANGETAEAAEN